MPHDSPATDAGTDERPTEQTDANTPDTWAPINRRTMRDDVDRFRNERMQSPANLAAALALTVLALEYYEHAQEVATRSVATLATLDMEGDQLREQWTRILLGEAMGLSVDQREAGAGGATAKSRNAAKEIIDTIPAMVAHNEHRAKIAQKKAEAEKELGVARRRHATAITFAHAFTFATADAISDPATIAGTNGAAVPDVQAGDSEHGTLSEVTT